AARMRELVEQGKDLFTAEPLYVLLSLAGHPDAHEAARVLARQARAQNRPLAEILRQDSGLQTYLQKLTPEQRAILDDRAKYRGASAQRTRAICEEWEKRVKSLEASP